MECNICKQNKATVHLTEIINDEVTELHLCEECAKAKGAEMQQHFSIADLLSGLVDLPPDAATKKEHISIKCDSCNMSYADFKKMGRLGCAQCYETFKRALYPLLKRIHGTTRHIGKEPVPRTPTSSKVKTAGKTAKSKLDADRIEILKTRLAEAVRNEEFEKAAVLRDKIKTLEGKKKR
ncbi:MAG: UvrB/UvrC motif-containing protein [Candidatus Omnitrophica bacterium]|nr:UvrB/UvrC motif-containing protein [Candidatus Omnitrophota bacterium]